MRRLADQGQAEVFYLYIGGGLDRPCLQVYRWVMCWAAGSVKKAG